MLIGIDVAHSPAGSKGVYLRHAFRKKLEMPNVSVAVLAHFNGTPGLIENVRIILGAVAPTPKRALEAEALAKGKTMDGDLLARVALLASEESSPISDMWATAEYRREMVKVLVERAFNRIMNF
jgi:carbon-monoxide dehydrogenase medium subunit